MPALNTKDYLISALNVQHTRLVNDFKALPDEAKAKSHGGCARTPLSFLVECAALNMFIADILEKGDGKRLTDEEEAALYKRMDTAEKALAMLDDSVAKLRAAYDALDENTLGDITDKPFGRPMQKFGPACLPINHMMYHDGQLNFLQTLYGDDKIHW